MTEILYNKFYNIKLILAALCVAVYFGGVVLSGGSVAEVLLFWCAISLYILAPGYFFYKILKLEKDISSQTVSLSCLLGTGFFAVVFCISARFGFWYAVKIIPAVLGIYTIIKNLKNIKNSLQTRIFKNNQFALMAFIYGGRIFVFTFLCVVKHAHPSVVGELDLSQDFMWTVGNAESFKMGFPPIDIRFSEVRLWYHYLTELLAGGISVVSGISCYNILGFYMQSFILLFLICALYELGKLFYYDRRKANFFMLSFFALSCVSLYNALPNGTSLFSNSLLQTLLSNVNSQATAFAYLATFVSLFVNLSRKKGNVSVIYYATTFCAFFLLMFSKSPIAAIVIIALMCAELVSLVLKNTNLKEFIFSVFLFLVFFLVYTQLLSSGANHSTMFDLINTMCLGYFGKFIEVLYAEKGVLFYIAIPVFMILQTLCIAPFQFICVVPQMFKSMLHISKLKTETLWGFAAIIGGFLAFYISYHEAFSQVYFMYPALFFSNLLAVEFFDFDKFSKKNAIKYIAISLSMITTMFMYINFVGSGVRQELHNYDILEKYPYMYIVKSEDELAGEYLRENMLDGELFTTNRYHTGWYDGLSNVYTCFRGKQAYMEGYKYTVSNMGVSKEIVDERVELVCKTFAINGFTPYTYDEIKDELTRKNIRYVVYSSEFPGDATRLESFETVFSDKTVKIYKIY